MKKSTLLGVITLISFSTFAQNKGDKGSGIGFGVKVGVTFANFASFNSGLGTPDPLTTNSVTSFYVGGVVNIPVGSMFAVQPGLTLIGKGANTVPTAATSASGATGGIKETPWYLEVPVNVTVNFEAGPGKIFVGAGPYLGFGLFGKYTNSFVVNGAAQPGTKASGNIKFGTNSATDFSNDLKTLDFGLNFLLGYQLKNGFSINGGYSLGLTNISPDAGIAGNTSSYKNGVFSVGLGFAF